MSDEPARLSLRGCKGCVVDALVDSSCGRTNDALRRLARYPLLDETGLVASCEDDKPCELLSSEGNVDAGGAIEDAVMLLAVF